MMAVVMLLALITSACKEDEEAPQTAPDWLVPYQGYYEGTFEGDDTGTWHFTITYLAQFEMFVTSGSDNDTYSRIITLNENGTFAFSDAEVVLAGGIIDFNTVAGTWQELFDGTEGTFMGEKQ